MNVYNIVRKIRLTNKLLFENKNQMTVLQKQSLFLFTVLEERLTRQEEDNDRERKRLEELIARMETQLREQTRSLEEVSVCVCLCVCQCVCQCVCVCVCVSFLLYLHRISCVFYNVQKEI